MNNLLQKCLEELAQEKPRLDYVRGILETVIALGDSSTVEHSVVNRKVGGAIPPPPAERIKDEGTSIEIAAIASLDTIKKMSAEAAHL